MHYALKSYLIDENKIFCSYSDLLSVVLNHIEPTHIKNIETVNVNNRR